MDFHGKSSSRSSSSVSASELSQYNTHLILALPSGEVLTSNYRNFHNSFAQGLMNTADKKVSLEIPLNTQMKIFAFLFKETYSLSDLISGYQEVGYYGKSQSFTIGSQTDSLRLNIRLKQVPGANTDTPTELEGTWKTACYTDSDNYSNYFTPTFAGNVLTLKDEKHSDTSCATDYSLTESSHTFSIGDTGKFLITLGSTIKRTPQSTSAVSSYNSSSNCGYSDWELNTAKDCTNEDAGDPIYCFYQLSGNTLYVECNESSYPTTSDIDTSDASSTFVKQ
jgi:hypothetical protein